MSRVSSSPRRKTVKTGVRPGLVLKARPVRASGGACYFTSLPRSLAAPAGAPPHKIRPRPL